VPLAAEVSGVKAASADSFNPIEGKFVFVGNRELAERLKAGTSLRGKPGSSRVT
jgi:hypothetical protein